MNKNNTNAVPLNTTTFNTRLLNTTRLNTNGFPVLSKRSGSSADISQAIMDSLVCWYDPGKQQCTNESMAANPVLADLSGNGHDIECFNFGWAGMSGIGCYTNFKALGNRANIEILGEQHWLINSINQDNTINRECIVSRKEDFNTFFCGKTIQVKLTGNVLSESYFRINNTRTYLKEGVNEITIPAIDSEDFINGPYLIFTFPLETVNVEVEILPLYPNALVSDGVDDYIGTIPGFPKDEGTAIVIMQELEGNKSSALLMPSDKEGFSNVWYNGLFVGGNANNQIGFYNNNGGTTEIEYNEDEAYAKNTSIFTWNNSIPKETINLNNRESKEASYEQLHTQYNFFKDNNTNSCAKAALYSFLLFDRTLTTAEIEWVKKNMIESGGC